MKAIEIVKANRKNLEAHYKIEFGLATKDGDYLLIDDDDNPINTVSEEYIRERHHIVARDS